MRNDPKWIIVELSSESDLLTELAAELSGNERFAELFRNEKINLSFFGFGAEMKGIAVCPSGKIMDIRTFLQMETNEFNPYRKRLIDKGLINGDERGYVKVLLPLFEEYVIDKFAE